MGIHKTGLRCAQAGQSLVEIVLMMPLLLLVLLNAVNFGYFFFVVLNLTAAPRNGVEYTIMGSATPAATAQPLSGPPSGILSVSYVTYQDMTGALANPSGATVQVCTATNVSGSPLSGLNGPGTPTETAKCVVCTGGTCGAPGTGTWAPHSDPESNSSGTAPAFVLNRVDVQYQFIPLIPGTPFNIALLASPICTSTGGNLRCTFHRFTEMRAMN
jgi:Flp pilus assembly protein TadG